MDRWTIKILIHLITKLLTFREAFIWNARIFNDVMTIVWELKAARYSGVLWVNSEVVYVRNLGWLQWMSEWDYWGVKFVQFLGQPRFCLSHFCKSLSMWIMTGAMSWNSTNWLYYLRVWSRTLCWGLHWRFLRASPGTKGDHFFSNHFHTSLWSNSETTWDFL